MCGERNPQRPGSAPSSTKAADDAVKAIHAVPIMSPLMQRVIINFRWSCGLLLLINFMIFWALPIFLQGQMWRFVICGSMRKIFALFDENKTLRNFALKYIYSKEVYTDFFAISFLLFLQCTASVSLLFYWQITYQTLPWWLIYLHYFQWVGMGGRGMGAAYSLAHKEGHHRGGGLYRPWIAGAVGNFWENWMGHWYGNVPYNFSTSHVFLHHALDGGKGDTFYQFDLDRSSVSDLLLYLYRILVHMTGYSSLVRFRDLAADGNRVMRDNHAALRRGMLSYWVCVPAAIVGVLAAGGCSPAGIAWFMFYVYLQPLFGMSFFLAFINFALHGFLEFEPDGKHIACIQSTVIVDGHDDMFGEDDHMAHHYYGNVTHRDLPEHHRTQVAEWARHKASVFKDMAIVELSALMLFKEWRRLAERHYVDHSRSLSVEAAAALLEARARRVEMSYADYEFRFLPTIRARAAALVSQGVCGTLEQAYKHIAHYNIKV